MAALSTHAGLYNPPQVLSYQGYLSDQAGNPLGNTNTGPKNYNVIFRVWNLQTGGTIGGVGDLYAEQQTVTVTSGYFSVLLGLGSQVGAAQAPAVGDRRASGHRRPAPARRLHTDRVRCDDEGARLKARG